MGSKNGSSGNKSNGRPPEYNGWEDDGTESNGWEIAKVVTNRCSAGTSKSTESERIPIKVIAYMTSWCPDCTRSRRVLQRSGVEFAEIDIEKIPNAEEAMRQINGGSGKVPTILVETCGSRQILVEPADRDLTDAIRHARKCASADSLPESESPEPDATSP